MNARRWFAGGRPCWWRRWPRSTALGAAVTALPTGPLRWGTPTGDGPGSVGNDATSTGTGEGCTAADNAPVAVGATAQDAARPALLPPVAALTTPAPTVASTPATVPRAALPVLLAPTPGQPAGPPLPEGPQVGLGFRDGSVTLLHPDSQQARRLAELAELLISRD